MYVFVSMHKNTLSDRKCVYRGEGNDHSKILKSSKKNIEIVEAPTKMKILAYFQRNALDVVLMKFGNKI